MIFVILVLSGILSAVSTMTPYTGFIAFFAIAPFLYFIFRDDEKPKRKLRFFLYGFTYSTAFFLTVYHWFYYMYPMEFMGFSKVGAFFACLFFQIGLSLLQSLPYSLMPLLFILAQRKSKPFLYPFVFASIYVIFEYLQSLTWMGVPWARLAISQVEFTPFIKTASLFGSLFITFVIVLINGFLALGFIFFKKSGRFSGKCSFSVLCALSAFLLVTGVGFILVYFSEKPSDDSGFTVSLIQTNIGSSDKWNTPDYDIMSKTEELTLSSCKDSDVKLIVWPETLFIEPIKESAFFNIGTSYLSEKTNAVIIAGSFENVDADGYEKGKYNSLIAFYPDGTIEDTGYFKRHLVPFGEYMPSRKFFDTFLPFLSEVALLEEDLLPGTDSEILDTGFGKAGRLICFDSIYPDLTKDAVKDGAEFIILSTNDSWYKDSSAVYQHLSHARLRAIESGRYIARCATSGISAIITPNGKITESLGALKEGYVKGTVYPLTDRTLYSYIGDLIVILSSVFLASLVILNIKDGKISFKKKKSV